MKKFQQSKVAIKIALPIILGSILFLGACSNEKEELMIDTELKDYNYYKERPDEVVKKVLACDKFKERDPKTNELKRKIDKTMIKIAKLLLAL